MFEMLNGDYDWDRLEVWECKRVQFQALHRALSGAAIPKSIRTADLVSPVDGKPVKYTFNGSRIVIEVSGYYDDSGKPALLRVPVS